MQASGVKHTNIYSSMFYLSNSHRQCHVVWEFSAVCSLLGLLFSEINMHCVIKKEPSSCCSDLYSLLHWCMHLLFVKGWQPWKPKLSIYPQSEIPLSVEGMPKALIVNDAVVHTKKFSPHFLARIILPCEGELLKWKLNWRMCLTKTMGLQLGNAGKPWRRWGKACCAVR